MVKPEEIMLLPLIYEVRIQGHLREKLADWFAGKLVKINTTVDRSSETTLLVSVPDQAALRGILNNIWDLNLTLISVNPYQPKTNGGGADEY